LFIESLCSRSLSSPISSTILTNQTILEFELINPTDKILSISSKTVWLTVTQDSSIESCDIFEHTHRGVYISDSSEFNTIVKNKIHHNNEYGILLTRASVSILENNIFENKLAGKNSILLWSLYNYSSIHIWWKKSKELFQSLIYFMFGLEFILLCIRNRRDEWICKHLSQSNSRQFGRNSHLQ
jgi:parallel beta-helix repeat protein